MRREDSIRNYSKVYMIYVMGTIVFILAMFLLVKKNVVGREQSIQMDRMISVDVMEQEYIEEVENELSGFGFINSGVTMTKMMEGTEKFYYHIQIHHKDLDKVSFEERNGILYSLKNLSKDIKNRLKIEGIIEEVYFTYEII